ncbi:MAG: TlpA family protein disulfide reductase [endosymbiont of Galathealinum brachiosum]|uniref:TlpA family protein disulfide reductase n=1 Tax=endosymbiont of Galathealinum brachiosum TaxID=2200906 RepID=A0A370DA23_9GAMM|nr:MAG: TlpA family protein disulfide reductase [endosymbiont of Galathealinum brachiosum]
MSIKQLIISISIFLLSSQLFSQVTSAAEAISFSSKDLQGDLHTIERYRGKWIVVNYWGIFCGPCLREMPELSVFHNQHKETDAVVLGINQEELPIEVMASFRDKMKISFPLLSVPFEQVTPFGNVTILPTTFIISPEGKLVARQQGAITMQMLEDYIQRNKHEFQNKKQPTKSNENKKSL